MRSILVQSSSHGLHRAHEWWLSGHDDAVDYGVMAEGQFSDERCAWGWAVSVDVDLFRACCSGLHDGEIEQETYRPYKATGLA